MDPLKRVNILFNVLTMLQSSSALENEVGIQQCQPRCRPVNLRGRQIFADLNLVLLRRRNTSFSCDKLHHLWMKVMRTCSLEKYLFFLTYFNVLTKDRLSTWRMFTREVTFLLLK